MIVSSYPHNAADSWPDKIAILQGDRKLTYGELSQSIHQCAEQLAKSGLKKGDVVGIEAPDSIEFIVLVFASLECEATVLPLSPLLTEHEIKSFKDRIGLSAMLFSRKPSGVLKNHYSIEVTPGRRVYYCAYNDADTLPLSAVSDPAFIRFTSGTTGTSKGVLVSHRSVHERTAAAYHALGMQAGDTMCWVLPMSYHFIVSLVLYVRFGITIAITDGTDADAILTCIEEHESSYLYAAPDHYQRLIQYEHTRSLTTLKRAISTSSSLSAQTASKFEALYRIPISQVYGIIEIGLPAGNLENASTRSDSIGKAFDGYQVAILDDQGNELPSLQEGQLAMRGPGMFDAYLCPFRLREEVLSNGWFLTGDTAWKDHDGTITVAGRRTSVIHIEDKKVFPEEIEHILNNHDDVQQSRVYGDSSPDGTEFIVAEIVRRSPAVNGERLQQYCSKALAPWKIPHEFHFVQSLQMTPTGKISRAQALAATLAA